MKVEATKSFAKDLKTVPVFIREQVFKMISSLENAESLSVLSFDIKKCKGSKVYYRIRLGQYRIGLKYIHPDVLLTCCLIRGEIYKTFPPK